MGAKTDDVILWPQRAENSEKPGKSKGYPARKKFYGIPCLRELPRTIILERAIGRKKNSSSTRVLNATHEPRGSDMMARDDCASAPFVC